MKELMKKVSLLGLSFMLVTPFAVSSALPDMLVYYGNLGYSTAQVELLFSLSSLMILGVLLASPLINRLFSERQALITGLLMVSFGGVLPTLTQLYPLVFASRLILGFGVGLMNAHAINIISHYYQGQERTKLLGLRGSSEVLGSATLTFLAGQLLTLGWEKSYLVYLIGLVMLGLYLIFVPKDKQEVRTEVPGHKVTLTRKQILYLLSLAFYAGFVILLNTANTLRIPVFVESLKIGTASQASFILTAMMLMGIVAGTVFGQALSLLKKWFMPAVAILLGLGMLVIWQSHSLFMIGLGAVVTGIVYNLGVTLVFHKVSEKFPSHQLGKATTLVLLGCNLGGGGAAFALQAIGLFSSDSSTAFLVLGSLSLVLGLALLPKAIKS